MQDSALRWSQCISCRNSFSLLVGSGNRSAAGGGAGGFDALIVVAGTVALGEPLRAAASALASAVLAGAGADVTGDVGATIAAVALGALGARTARAATGR